MSCLQQRKQSAKVKGLSGLLQLIKSGVPQGSIFGHILLNIFINDIYFSLQEDLYNFADDNTVSAIADSLQALLEVLTEKANTTIDWFQLNDMIVNPGKFKAILLQKNRRNISEYPIVSTGHEIKTQESVTLLGVTIDYKLSFEEYISNLCQKASAQLNALTRLGAFMSHQTRKIMVQSFILAHFNYCPLVWYFTSAKQINKMEKGQERALRFITDDYNSSYENLLNDSDTSTTDIRRVHSLCTEIFKSLNNLNAPYMKGLFHRNVTTYSLRSSNDLLVPIVNQTTFGLRSIRYDGALMWNQLLKHIKTCKCVYC